MKPLSKEEFGQRLRSLRKKAKLDQTKLAEKIGVKQGTVSRWEKGLAEPEQVHVESLCDFFNVDESYFSDEAIPRRQPQKAESGHGSRSSGSSAGDLWRDLLFTLAALDEEEIRSILEDARAAVAARRGDFRQELVPAPAKRSPKG